MIDSTRSKKPSIINQRSFKKGVTNNQKPQSGLELILRQRTKVVGLDDYIQGSAEDQRILKMVKTLYAVDKNSNNYDN